MTQTISDPWQPCAGSRANASLPELIGCGEQLAASSQSHWRSLRLYSTNALLITAISIAAGCGPQGPQRYDLSGDVTYDGKQVSKGYMTFEPDSAKGNSGPGAAVDIVDGHYTTRAGQGTVGGPHVVTVSGFDGVAFEQSGVMNPMGRPMFEDVKIEIDVPKEAATRDFELP